MIIEPNRKITTSADDSSMVEQTVTPDGPIEEPERELHILFDGPLSHESGRFVEVEDENGAGCCVGRWEERNGLWHYTDKCEPVF